MAGHPTSQFESPTNSLGGDKLEEVFGFNKQIAAGIAWQIFTSFNLAEVLLNSSKVFETTDVDGVLYDGVVKIMARVAQEYLKINRKLIRDVLQSRSSTKQSSKTSSNKSTDVLHCIVGSDMYPCGDHFESHTPLTNFPKLTSNERPLEVSPQLGGKRWRRSTSTPKPNLSEDPSLSFIERPYCNESGQLNKDCESEKHNPLWNKFSNFSAAKQFESYSSLFSNLGSQSKQRNAFGSEANEPMLPENIDAIRLCFGNARNFDYDVKHVDLPITDGELQNNHVKTNFCFQNKLNVLDKNVHNFGRKNSAIPYTAFSHYGASSVPQNTISVKSFNMNEHHAGNEMRNINSWPNFVNSNGSSDVFYSLNDAALQEQQFHQFSRINPNPSSVLPSNVNALFSWSTPSNCLCPTINSNCVGHQFSDGSVLRGHGNVTGTNTTEFSGFKGYMSVSHATEISKQNSMSKKDEINSYSVDSLNCSERPDDDIFFSRQLISISKENNDPNVDSLEKCSASFFEEPFDNISIFNEDTAELLRKNSFAGEFQTFLNPATENDFHNVANPSSSSLAYLSAPLTDGSAGCPLLDVNDFTFENEDFTGFSLQLNSSINTDLIQTSYSRLIHSDLQCTKGRKHSSTAFEYASPNRPHIQNCFTNSVSCQTDYSANEAGSASSRRPCYNSSFHSSGGSENFEQSSEAHSQYQSPSSKCSCVSPVALWLPGECTNKIHNNKLYDDNPNSLEPSGSICYNKIYQDTNDLGSCVINDLDHGLCRKCKLLYTCTAEGVEAVSWDLNGNLNDFADDNTCHSKHSFTDVKMCYELNERILQQNCLAAEPVVGKNLAFGQVCKTENCNDRNIDLPATPLSSKDIKFYEDIHKICANSVTCKVKQNHDLSNYPVMCVWQTAFDCSDPSTNCTVSKNSPSLTRSVYPSSTRKSPQKDFTLERNSMLAQPSISSDIENECSRNEKFISEQVSSNAYETPLIDLTVYCKYPVNKHAKNKGLFEWKSESLNTIHECSLEGRKTKNSSSTDNLAMKHVSSIKEHFELLSAEAGNYNRIQKHCSFILDRCGRVSARKIDQNTVDCYTLNDSFQLNSSSNRCLSLSSNLNVKVNNCLATSHVLDCERKKPGGGLGNQNRIQNLVNKFNNNSCSLIGRRACCQTSEHFSRKVIPFRTLLGDGTVRELVGKFESLSNRNHKS